MKLVDSHEYYIIKIFCSKNGFEYIWFNTDIEDVYLRHSVPDGKKTQEAKKYKTSHCIDKVDEVSLTKKTCVSKSTSNILTVLDKYLNRK